MSSNLIMTGMLHSFGENIGISLVVITELSNLIMTVIVAYDEPHYKPGVYSFAPEGCAVPTPHAVLVRCTILVYYFRTS